MLGEVPELSVHEPKAEAFDVGFCEKWLASAPCNEMKVENWGLVELFRAFKNPETVKIGVQRENKGIFGLTMIVIVFLSASDR